MYVYQSTDKYFQCMIVKMTLCAACEREQVILQGPRKHRKSPIWHVTCNVASDR